MSATEAPRQSETNARRPPLRLIIRTVCDHTRVKPAEVTGASRARRLVNARQIAIYLCRLLTAHSLPVISSHFGNRDHTTALHACRAVEARIQVDRDFADKVSDMHDAIVAAFDTDEGGTPIERAKKIARVALSENLANVTGADIRALASTFLEVADGDAEPVAATAEKPPAAPAPTLLPVRRVPPASSLDTLIAAHHRLRNALYSPGEAAAREAVISAVANLAKTFA